MKTVTTILFLAVGILYPKSYAQTSFPAIEMIFVQGGTFDMGCTSEQGVDCYRDENPVHKVTLNSFYIGKYEVTQAQWEAVMGDNPGVFSDCGNCPAENVSWEQVQEFIRKLNLQTGMNYRLPTEAEWEYAARGGAQSKGYTYSGSNNVDEVAWYANNAEEEIHTIGTKRANELGIYDMSGNVWEWCSDWYGNYSSSAQTNPKGPANGSHRVNRSGSWGSGISRLHVSARSGSAPEFRNFLLGFRLARNVK